MTYKQKKNRLFSKATLYARKKWNNMFEIIKERNELVLGENYKAITWTFIYIQFNKPPLLQNM